MIRSNLFPVLVFFAASLMSCSFFSQGTKTEFVVTQTPKFELNEIDALKVGQFKGQPLVKISLPVEAEGPPDLSPGVLSFEADQSSEHHFCRTTHLFSQNSITPGSRGLRQQCVFFF